MVSYLLALYFDELIFDIVRQSGGCTYHFVSVCIVYADDIILLALSVAALQRLVSLCEENLLSLELAINIKKSVCTRIGPRFNAPCTKIVTSDGSALQWVDSMLYATEDPRCFLIRSRIFKCSLEHTKQSFSAYSMRFMVK